MKRNALTGTLLTAAIVLMLAGCGGGLKEKVEEPAGIDWPMYGGAPSRLGYSAETMTPPFQLRWNADTGKLEGGAVAAEERVCVADVDGVVYCYDAADGEVDWTYQANGPIRGQTPLIYDSRVFVGTAKGTFYCLNARGGGGQDGLRMWEKDLGPGAFSSPLGDNGRVYVSHGPGLYCFEDRKGEQVFNYVEAGVTSITAPTLGQGRVCFGTDTGSLVCLDASNGSVAWRAQMGAEISTSPVISDARVYFGTADNQLWCLDLAAGGTVWSTRIKQKVSSPPAIAGSSLVIGTGDEESLATGVVWCLDAAGGGLRWSYETDYSSPMQVSVTGQYAFAYNGLVLNLAGGTVVTTIQLGGGPYAQPVPYGGCLYVCDSGGALYCLGP